MKSPEKLVCLAGPKHRRMQAVPRHVKEPVSVGKKATAEDRRIHKLVLAEDIHLLIGDSLRRHLRQDGRGLRHHNR